MEVKEIAESFIDLYKDRVEEDKLSPKNQREVPEYQYDCLELANTYIDLLTKQEGVVLVPAEPTEEEGNVFYNRYFDGDVWGKANHIRLKAGLEAMIAKAKENQ